MKIRDLNLKELTEDVLKFRDEQQVSAAEAVLALVDLGLLAHEKLNFAQRGDHTVILSPFTDVDGEEIGDGDVLGGQFEGPYLIQLKDGEWPHYTEGVGAWATIVGNIHENPELEESCGTYKG